MMAFILALLLDIVAVTLFVVLIIRRNHGHREPTGALFAAMGFGVLAVVIASIVEPLVLPRTVLDYQGETSIPISDLLAGVLVIGIIEETAKSIPLALWIYKRRYFSELIDCVIYFGISALSFGVIEDIFYALDYGGWIGVIRIVLSPYVHIGFALLFGVPLAYRKVLKKPWLWVMLGYIGAIGVHALYDFCAFGGFGDWGVVVMPFLAIALDVSLFVLFRRLQKQDEREGRSAVGIHKFCRHCGKPNPQQLLYLWKIKLKS